MGRARHDAFHPAGGACFGTVTDRDGAVVGARGRLRLRQPGLSALRCVNPTLTIAALAFRLAAHLGGR